MNCPHCNNPTTHIARDTHWCNQCGTLVSNEVVKIPDDARIQRTPPRHTSISVDGNGNTVPQPKAQQ